MAIAFILFICRKSKWADSFLEELLEAYIHREKLSPSIENLKKNILKNKCRKELQLINAHARGEFEGDIPRIIKRGSNGRK